MKRNFIQRFWAALFGRDPEPVELPSLEPIEFYEVTRP